MPRFLPLGPYGPLLPVHAGMMILALLLMLASAFFPRYLKRRKWWLKGHMLMGTLGVGLGVGGAGTAAQMVVSSGRSHLRSPHAITAAVTLALSLAAPVVGMVMFEGSGKLRGYRPAHRWVGRAAFAALAGTLALGLLQSGWLRP